jgi:hypothetical protein
MIRAIMVIIFSYEGKKSRGAGHQGGDRTRQDKTVRDETRNVLGLQLQPRINNSYGSRFTVCLTIVH